MRPAEPIPRHRPVTAADAVGGAAALVRFSAMGGSLILPLVGLASAAGPVSGREVVLAIAIGIAFHVSVYVLNDVVDLRIDRTDPRRVTSPLVTGLVTPAAAVVLSLVMLVVALAIAAQAGAPVSIAVVAAVVGLGAYDLLGKLTRWPPVTDTVQALGWAALVLAGAWLAGGPTQLAWALAAYIVVFIVMANGIHGAIRDLPNDRRHGVLTTAAVLGARATADGRRIVPRAVMGLAWLLQGGLVAVTVVAVTVGGGSILAVAPSIAAVALLAAATRARSDADLLSAGMLHLLVALAVPITLVVGVASPGLVAVLIGVYVVPVLSHGWLPGAMSWGLQATGRAARSARDLVLLTRPHNALAAGIAVIVGAHLGGQAALLVEPVLRAAVVAMLVVAAANVANDRADVVEDRINRPERPIAAGRVSSRAAALLASLLAVVALGVCLPLGPGPTLAALGLTAVALAYAVRLKGVLLVGNLVVAGLSASAILFGGLVAGGATPALAIGATFVFVSILSSEWLKCLADRDGDRAAGRSTIATELPVHVVLRWHAVLVVLLIGLVLLPAVTGIAPPAFLPASLIGVVGPQLLILRRLRGVREPAAVRPVLPLVKAAWFTGLAALLFLA